MESTESDASLSLTSNAVAMLSEARQIRDEFTKFMLSYKFGMEEITTKMRILQEEFRTVHSYNPIEHLTGRLKTPESLMDKLQRKGCSPDFGCIRDNITDIAGVRVVCSFTSDVYRVFDMLTSQEDIHVRRVKDYVENPKPNGYRSLHAIVEVPVFLSDRSVQVPVEVQFRTAAMEFWASLEHKIYYKYDREVPEHLQQDLKRAAVTATQLDTDMERIHHQIHGTPGDDDSTIGGMELSEHVIMQLLRQRTAVSLDANLD